MNTKTFTAPLAALLISFFSVNAQAAFIDFATMADGAWGESAYAKLEPGVFGLEITGGYTDSGDDKNGFAYLDAGNAGLGVCKNATNLGATANNTSNRCLNEAGGSNAGDDNVTTDEYLELKFAQDVVIEKLWFNNSHDDPKGFVGSDRIDIGGNPFAVTSGYVGDPSSVIGTFSLLAGETLVIAYNNEQFYVSGMEISAVPVPAAVWLFGTAMAGLLGFRRRQKTA